ncbi:PfkB family carbohydrate kinase [Streptomyces hoynatensis]|uniref:Carbohydrate kinase n=1 Tax=Streptomyces hoynatensis TaxID=1141874 RepID=A0A3A9YSC3_9ACTN|nr:PfkB family carbohydrate kinase [Streptomyces hoynatensis]RKN38952.1 carbohydrate kinase [Streptomyces hoynatensis]
MRNRVTVVGEALVDLLWRAGARELRAVPGGSPANVAVGLHRLEREVTLLTAWGDDPPGELVRAHLAGTGVEVRRLPAESDRTTVALAYLGADGAASYDFLAAWDPSAFPVPEDTAVLHTGSLAVAIEPGASRVFELCRAQRARGVTVAADLNVRPAVLPDREAYRQVAGRLAGSVDVLKASEEDLAWLYPGAGPAQAARTLLAAGPRLIVVTLGAAGALAVAADAKNGGPGGGEAAAGLDGLTEVAVAAPAVAVADTVGAGDAFQAALLDAIVTGGGPPVGAGALSAVLTRCAAAAALTCTRVGADPPHRSELTDV